jgi:hypothetical protein
MAGAGFHSIANPWALIPRTATTILFSLAISSPMFCGLPTPTLRPNMNPGDGSDLWQFALKCRLRTLAISSIAIFVVAIRGQHTAVCHGRVKDLSAEFSNRVKSSPRNFTLRDHLFEMSYLFQTRLYKSKTDTRSNV